MTNVKDAVSILEKVLAGDMSADEALRAWPSAGEGSNEVMNRARHELTHYAADADIRVRDPDYADYQREWLKIYVSKLSSASDDGQA